MKNFVEELKWRGMIHDIMPGTEEQFLKEVTAAYVGFDPTADSLHIGNLATIMLLVHLQQSGHKPVALVGGATGMIGDPSGKSAERNLLTEEQIRHNQECIHKQLQQFLDFDCGANSAEIVNNYDWFKGIGFIDFLRDAGKHLTVSYMMAKDSVKNRLETGISFTEFSYQLLQGYDFYHLYKEKNCKLQMGGSDQWGNITSGTELIRRMASGEAYALTCPLITKSDGTKFGKTESGAVWLDAKRTSPYQFYQFWLNVSDEDSKKLIRVFTILPEDEILSIEKKHEEAPHLRALQEALAKDITIRVHSEEDYDMAVKASKILFDKKATDVLKEVDEPTLLAVFEGVPTIEVNDYDKVETLADLVSNHCDGKVFSSKGEAKRMIKDGGLRINKEKATDADEKPNFDLIQDKYLMIQKGKKNFYLIKAV
ncbi:MAG: tyrosine--tRNA ligase [Cyclobacteriaceae bacterium]